MNIYTQLAIIQKKLKANKDQHNKFGDFNYRSAESILEAVKPLLDETKTVLILSDQMKQLGDRYYIEATATIILADDPQQRHSNTAYAREEETKKGMDGSQITGSSSSYARKYALNGLFAIDDNKDSDYTNHYGKDDDDKQKDTKPKDTKPKETLEELNKRLNDQYKDTDTGIFTASDYPISQEKLKYITDIIRAYPVERVMKFNEWLEKTYKARTITELTDGQATSVIAAITKK